MNLWQKRFESWQNLNVETEKLALMSSELVSQESPTNSEPFKLLHLKPEGKVYLILVCYL